VEEEDVVWGAEDENDKKNSNLERGGECYLFSRPRAPMF
jgi:hypothetical protein